VSVFLVDCGAERGILVDCIFEPDLLVGYSVVRGFLVDCIVERGF
jgi:hypothetical protein